MKDKAPWYTVIARIFGLLCVTLLGYLFALNIGILAISLCQGLGEEFGIEELQILNKIFEFIMKHPTGSIITAILGYLAYTWYFLTSLVKYLVGKGKV